LQAKLETLAKQYQLREEQWSHEMKKAELEKQLYEAKLLEQTEIAKRESLKVIIHINHLV